MKKTYILFFIYIAIKIFQFFCATIIYKVSSSEAGVRMLAVMFSWLICYLIIYVAEKFNLSKYPIRYTLVFIVCMYLFFLSPVFLLQSQYEIDSRSHMIFVYIIAFFLLGYFAAEAKILKTIDMVFKNFNVLFQIFVLVAISVAYYFFERESTWYNIAAFIMLSLITYILSKSTFFEGLLKALKPKQGNQIPLGLFFLGIGAAVYALSFVSGFEIEYGMAFIGAMYIYMNINDRLNKTPLR